MKTSLHKGLLILMMLALAIAPLRVSWSMPVGAMPDSADHCAQMQGNTPATDAGTALHAQDTDIGSGYDYNGCCGGDCNGSDCSACAHGAAAASSSISASPDAPNSPLITSFVQSYPERTISPPLRPPASL